jgi:integrase
MNEAITRTATVVVRHSAGCRDRERGAGWRKCACPKSLVLYDGADKRNRRMSAKTRSWERAEAAAQEWLDGFNPDKIELKALKAAKEGATVTVEKAVGAYVADMVSRLGDNGTVRAARMLLGDVDPETAEVRKRGKLLAWLDGIDPRPAAVSDVTSSHLDSWRRTWRFGSDLTAADAVVKVRTFFRFCRSRGWLAADPSADFRRPKVRKGSRTTVFTDEQYAKVLEAAKARGRRAEAFVEMLRWSGMSLVDAVQFRPAALDGDVLSYRRQKTGTTAAPVVPAHVAALLRSVPTDGDPAAPFRDRSIPLSSDTDRWRRLLQECFAEAGIESVRTDVGDRPPHPHMLRDTFAVGHIRAGVPLLNVARMLGHSDTKVTERHYLPWVKEMDSHHAATVRAALAPQLPKPAAGVVPFRIAK